MLCCLGELLKGVAVDLYLSCVSTFAGGPNDERLAGEERGAGCIQGNTNLSFEAYFWL